MVEREAPEPAAHSGYYRGVMASPRRLVFTLEGLKSEDGHVRLQAFLAQLAAIRKVLELARARSGANTYFRIVDLSHSSPVKITVEEVAKKGNKGPFATPGVRADVSFVKNSSSARIASRLGVDEDGYDYLEALEALAEPVGRELARMGIGSTSIDAEFGNRIKKALAPTERIKGSISGKLEVVDLHNKLSFAIFPTIGPKKVRGTFSEGLRQRVLDSIGRYVTIHGTLLYRGDKSFPFAATDLTEIEIHESTRASSLMDLWSEAPGITARKSTTDFLKESRHAW